LFELLLPERGLAVEGRPVDNGLTELLSGRADREPLTLGRRLKKSLLPTLLPVLRFVVLVGLPVIEDGRPLGRADEVDLEGLPVVGPAEPAELVDGRPK
jgi:hypothetical protein